LIDCPHHLALEVGSVEEHDRGVKAKQQQAIPPWRVVAGPSPAVKKEYKKISAFFGQGASLADPCSPK